MNVLFITYHAASYPIMESQGFSYMRGLFRNGVKYSLLTFETNDTLKESHDRVLSLGIPIIWRYLTYHRRPRVLATFFDIIFGIFTTLLIIKKDSIEIIHARGFIAAIIAILPTKVFRIKFFFDTRGFLADKYVCGGLLVKNSIIYKIMKWGEKVLIRKSDYLTLETYRHANVIKRLRIQNDIDSKMGVIPCCVNIEVFDYQLYDGRLINRFNLIYLGKVGTWYLIEDMMDFFGHLYKKDNRFQFIFITESDASYIYSVANKKGIAVSNIMVKMAKTNEVPSLLSGSHMGIFFMNPYRQYSFSPIKFGEYLACGLPVIINSGIGDCDEIVLKERVGVIVNGFTSEEYDKAISELNKLLSEGEEVLKERCRETAKKYFSLEKGIEDYLNIYKRLCT